MSPWRDPGAFSLCEEKPKHPRRVRGEAEFAGEARYNLGEVQVSSEIIFSVVESAEGGYEAHALGHSIHTQADSMDDLKSMVRDAVRCHFEEKDRPAVIRLHLVRDEVISA
jgi:hypothetical protein